MDSIEKTFMDPEKTFFAHEMAVDEFWMDKVVDLMSDQVYITFDLDALDPSIMPSTGTPEPGGLLWYETLEFLQKVFDEKNVVGFDLVELCPNPGDPSPNFLAAKLYYKMLSYKYREQESKLDLEDDSDDDYEDRNRNFNTKFDDDAY
jgi:agmatinase